MAGPRLVLASASPRRRELLTWLGYPFEVVAADVVEQVSPDVTPAAAARRLARAKAEAVQAAVGPAVVVGADTLVVLDGEVLGKPAGVAEARSMLRGLRGRAHEVMTGVVGLPLGLVSGMVLETGVAIPRTAAMACPWFQAARCMVAVTGG